MLNYIKTFINSQDETNYYVATSLFVLFIASYYYYSTLKNLDSIILKNTSDLNNFCNDHLDIIYILEYPGQISIEFLNSKNLFIFLKYLFKIFPQITTICVNLDILEIKSLYSLSDFFSKSPDYNDFKKLNLNRKLIFKILMYTRDNIIGLQLF